MTRVEGVLLAAGAGRRAGGPKALREDADGEPAVVRAIRVLQTGGCGQVVVVVGAAADDVRAASDASDPDVRIVLCPSWAEGVSASLRAGLLALDPETDVALVHLVDLPDVGPAVVQRVLDQARTSRQTLARATYEGRPGHPVLIGTDHITPLLATLDGDRGARDYLDLHEVAEVECGDLATGLDDDVSPVAPIRVW